MSHYPIYIPSKGRADRCHTARLLEDGDTPFQIVVEDTDHDSYAANYGEDQILVLPFRDQGISAARNWIKDHAAATGHKRHWQMDDDLKSFRRWDQGQRIRVEPNETLISLEEFVDRYENVALAGLQHTAFGAHITKPFSINQQCYTCVLILNELPHRWRNNIVEDTDYSLQVLAAGWCTVFFHLYQFQTKTSGSMSGGNTEISYAEDGRLKRARELQRRWPGLVTVKRKWGRPTQELHSVWNRFDTPLRKA